MEFHASESFLRAAAHHFGNSIPVAKGRLLDLLAGSQLAAETQLLIHKFSLEIFFR